MGPHVPFGFLLIHKPVGPTSHDIVAGVRRGIGIKKVGHAGTLDPLAEGVLVVAVGHATRLLEYLASSEKGYTAQIRLGQATDTYDAEGDVVTANTIPEDLTSAQIDNYLEPFRGRFQQVPPVYSSIKVKGKTAHSRVRAGEAVLLDPRPVQIFELSVVEYSPPIVTLNVRCSAGTYIRSLAHDLGAEIGCGAHLSGLVRTASGDFNLTAAVNWGDLQVAFVAGSWSKYVIDVGTALKHLPRVNLTEGEAEDIRHGRAIKASENLADVACAYTPRDRFVAILQGDSDHALWKPKKVFI